MAAYLLLGPVAGKETASWVCILAAAPVAVAGFFSYNGLTLEQFACLPSNAPSISVIFLSLMAVR